jgi:hypothetical protein
LDGNIGLVGLKISWDVARAFLTEAAWTVLPLDFLNASGDTNRTSAVFYVILVIF